ncbi:agmatine/peptidylarginine deiminase [uncultured Thiohalocapsa sp.]|uniref:agmatine deiminase family protein n=1 Tax=uncultured Thiohalocapsa sp. TaxID=768990 RepID=UPI0025D70D4F|nr:agmatine deiminase family protein [uncultured Thiohalocapsa sp.]
MRRRRLLKALVAGAAGSAAGDALAAVTHPPLPAGRSRWRMPDEAAPHRRTWMAFGASRQLWGRRLLPQVQRNLATIAVAVAEHEPVSLLVPPAEVRRARKLVGAGVELVTCPLDDVWIRDTGPVFVVDGDGSTAGIDFNFNGWGNKQAHAADARVAACVTRQAKARSIATRLVLEGGAIEVDGDGTAILTESCVLNDNRNPGLSKAALDAALKPLLGLKRIIWLPGIAGRDITDGHTDFYARFAAPGVVVAALEPDPRYFDYRVTRRHLEILRAARDARGRRLRVAVLEAPRTVRPRFAGADFAAGYVNFYVCNGAVLAPAFGDRRAHAAAKATLRELFPQRDVMQIDIDALAAGGGGIHCATLQEPAPA